MNKYDNISSLIHNLKYMLEDKGSLDKEIEMYLQIILKEIDNARQREHKTKQHIAELLARL